MTSVERSSRSASFLFSSAESLAVSLYNVSLGEEKSPDRVDGNQAGSSNVELVG